MRRWWVRPIVFAIGLFFVMLLLANSGKIAPPFLYKMF
jgi:hypothetical protein